MLLTVVHIDDNEVLFILHRPLNTGMGWAGPLIKTTN